MAMASYRLDYSSDIHNLDAAADAVDWGRADDSASNRRVSCSGQETPEHYAAASWTQTSSNDTTLHLVSIKFHQSFLYGSALSKTDFCLVSSDHVLYYVHRQVLRHNSNNFFNLLLKNDYSAPVPEKSAVLSIILHAVYDMPFGTAPSLNALITSINLFPKYGLEAKTALKAGTHLYTAVLDHSAHTPLLVFSFAAKLDLEDLAIASSEYTLPFTPNDLTEGMLNAIGTRYLMRLFRLQRHRTEALRNLLLAPLKLHSPSEGCTSTMQVRTSNDWKMATASLVYTAHPTMSCDMIDATYRRVALRVECEYCRQNMESRVKSLLVDWSNIKRTI